VDPHSAVAHARSGASPPPPRSRLGPILALFAFAQYYSFGKSYGRELFVEFIDLPKNQPA